MHLASSRASSEQRRSLEVVTHRREEEGEREEAEQAEWKKREETGEKSFPGESQSGVGVPAKKLEATRQQRRQPGAAAPLLLAFSSFYCQNLIVFNLLLQLHVLLLHLLRLFCEPHDLCLPRAPFLSSSCRQSLI